MAGSSSTILVRILGNNSGLSTALQSAYLSLGGLERISGTITSGFKVAAVAAGVFGAAAVAAGVLGAAALASIPLVLLGIGILAAAQSDRVRNAFSDMADHVVSVMKRIAQPLVEPLVRGAATIRRAFDLIAPSLARVFKAAAPLLDRLFAQLIPLARQLGPLFEEAFAAGAPVLLAFVKGLQPLTAGIREMFQILGTQTGAFRDFIDQLMKGLALILPALGRLLAAFAPIGAEILSSLLPAFASFLDLLATRVGPVFAMVSRFMTEHAQLVRVVVAALGGLVILAQIAQLFIALGTAIGLILSPAGLIVIAIAAIAGGLIYLWNNSVTARAAMQSIANVFTTVVVPAAKALGSYIVGTLVPAIVDTARKVGQNLQPIATAIARTFREDIAPAVRTATEKFRDAWPEIQKLAERIATAYKAGLEFWSAVAGKLIPILVKVAGTILGTVIPAVADYIVMMVRIINAIIDAVQAVGRFAAAVKDKFTEAVNFVRSIPGKIKAALGSVGGLLTSAGSALIGGFISGITSRIGDVESTLRGLTGKLTSWKGPPEKDEKLLVSAGQKVIQGFVKGIRGEIPEVKAALQSITDFVEKTMNARIKSNDAAAAAIRRVTSALKDERSELVENARAHDRILEKLDSARTKLKGIIQESKQYARTIKASIIEFGNITQFVDEAGQTTYASVVAGLQAKLDQAKSFRAGLAELARAGLDKRVLAQLADAGVEGGLQTVYALVDALRSGQTLDQINSLMREFSAVGGSLGSSLADTMYGAAITAAQALVDELAKKSAELAKIGQTLAAAFLAALRNAGIKIPRIKGGGGGGGNNSLVAAATASRTTAQPVQVNINVTAPVGSSSADIGRELESHLSAYIRAGGRRLAVG